MGMPSIDIIFQVQTQTILRRAQSGVVAVILRDAAASGAVTLKSEAKIPVALTADNQAYLRRAFIGYVTQPRMVLCYVLEENAADLSDALDWLATQQFDYLAAPPTVTESEANAVATWIKEQRTVNRAFYKAVLPNLAADNEAIINFTATGIQADGKTHTAAAYCSRIAGMLAGTPLDYSCTYAPLPEVTDIARMTRAEQDAAVDAGKFLLFWDGKQVLTGRAVNSLQTLTGKSEDYQKIKIVGAMDLMQMDLRSVFATSWIGKHGNSYDDKILLLTAVKTYFQGLEGQNVLQEGWTVVLDLDATRNYLNEKGVDTTEMSDAEILHSSTGSFVFMVAKVKILDAIEDIRLVINL